MVTIFEISGCGLNILIPLSVDSHFQKNDIWSDKFDLKIQKLNFENRSSENGNQKDFSNRGGRPPIRECNSVTARSQSALTGRLGWERRQGRYGK